MLQKGDIREAILFLLNNFHKMVTWNQVVSFAKKMGLFFLRKKAKHRGEGVKGGLAKYQTFLGIFSQSPSLIKNIFSIFSTFSVWS